MVLGCHCTFACVLTRGGGVFSRDCRWVQHVVLLGIVLYLHAGLCFVRGC